MLLNLNAMKKFAVVATDGDVGKVQEFYFDDMSWTVRYLVVETGSFLNRHQVLLSPLSIDRVELASKKIFMNLDKSAIESSPDVETHLPVTRKREMDFLGHYGLPYYWVSSMSWGGFPQPIALQPPPVTPEDYEKGKINDGTQDDEEHLQATSDVFDYKVSATDGVFGNVSDLLIELESWAIRYLVVDTNSWLPSKHVVVSPAWVDGISWEQHAFLFNVSKDEIKSAPDFHEGEFDESFETSVHAHYKRPPYWDTNVNELSGGGIIHSQKGGVGLNAS